MEKGLIVAGLEGVEIDLILKGIKTITTLVYDFSLGRVEIDLILKGIKTSNPLISLVRPHVT